MNNFCNDIVKPYSTYCGKSFIDSIRNRLNHIQSDENYIDDKRKKLIQLRAKSKNT